MEPSSPLSDHPAPDEDEPLLSREPLVAGRHRHGTRLSPRINALTLTLAATVVLVVGAAGLQHLRQQPEVSVPTSIPASLTEPLTPAPTMPAGQGWIPAGPPWAQQIVFAPSQPQTAYVCGTTGSRDPTRQTPVVLGMSGDSGQSWQTRTTHLSAISCQITVDPVDPRDLLLVLDHCATCSAPAPEQLYRTVDGGQNWLLVPFPPLGTASSPEFISFWWAWQGSTVFVWPIRSATSYGNLVAVSRAGGPFIWVNEESLLAQVPAGMQVNDIYATTSGVYVDFFSPGSGGCGNACILTKRSTDLGDSWTVFQPRYHGQPVYLLDQSVSIADGYTLLAQIYPGQNGTTRLYLRSTDGGATWIPLPALPGNLVMTTVASTPSGVLYTETWSLDVATATPGIYRLAPGTRAWVLVGALPESGVDLVVSWDAQGNPLALWSSSGSSGTSPQSTSLATHVP